MYPSWYETVSISVQSHLQVHRWCIVHNINNPELEKYLEYMYHIQLKLKYTTESITSASYLDLPLSIGRYGQIHTSIYDKRDCFSFRITNFTFLSNNIPSSPAYVVFITQLMLYPRACFTSECYILRARRLFSTLRKQLYLTGKSSFRTSYGRHGYLIQ